MVQALDTVPGRPGRPPLASQDHQTSIAQEGRSVKAATGPGHALAWASSGAARHGTGAGRTKKPLAGRLAAVGGQVVGRDKLGRPCKDFALSRDIFSLAGVQRAVSLQVAVLRHS